MRKGFGNSNPFLFLWDRKPSIKQSAFVNKNETSNTNRMVVQHNRNEVQTLR